MIINSIELKNFRCFYGKQTLSFRADGKITLIYGDSGYGKSSFLQFFRWMFYNDPDFGKTMINHCLILPHTRKLN